MAESAQPPIPSGGDVSRGATLIVLCSVLGFISTTTTIIRITVRSLSQQLGWDDFAISAATIFLITGEVLHGLSYGAGYGRHTVYLTPKQIQAILKWSFATQIFLYLVNSITKVSICLYILRIKSTGWLKWSMYALMAGLTITAAACSIIVLAQCQPIYLNWDRTNPHGSCWELKVYEDAIWAQVAFNIFSDMCCTLLPVVLLWNVRISNRSKVAISGLMSLGVLATICAAVRAVLTPNNESSDATWSLTPLSDWAVAEQNIGIIAANLALSRSVYQFCRKGRRSFNNHLADKQYQPSCTRQRPLVGAKADPNLSIPSLAEEYAIALKPARIRRTTSVEVISDSFSGEHDGTWSQKLGESATAKAWPGH